MKRIAVITPCILPVPTRKNGAVEGLITRLIDDNEHYGHFEIDLFTLSSGEYSPKTYTNLNFITVNHDCYSQFADIVLDKCYRTFLLDADYKVLDDKICEAFRDRLELQSNSYDAVIIENMMSIACRITEMCNGCYSFPIFFHMHNDVDIYRSPKQIDKLVKYGVSFIAVSEYIKSQILKYCPNAVVSTLYNGVDLSKYKRLPNINSDTYTLLYAGRIIPCKGVLELALSFKKLIEKVDILEKDKLRLIIAGFSGSDHKYEKKVLSIANKCNQISCLNHLTSDEMPSLYEKADVVIMPTKDEEPFGLVALETMAMGKPLIVTKSGALPEVVRDGALVVDKNEHFVENLEKCIIRVLNDKKLTTGLSERAYNRAHEDVRFDIKNYYDNFASIIEPDKITESDKISIIIPVYNVKDYLQRCVSSIADQSYNNTEIILVDDGSTDGSGDICDDLVGCDSRIKVIHQENIGLSGARNTGIDNATGRYLYFCDGDDYLEHNALEMLLNSLKIHNADVVACGIEKVFDNASRKESEQFTNNKPGQWSGHECIIQMMRNNNVCTVAWNKLYKAELFDGVRFPVGVKNEDEATIYKVLYKAKIVSYIPDTLYKYCQRDSSIMHEDLEDRYNYFIQAIQDRIAFFHDRGEDELEQHSRITLLEWIKYTYRNISNKEEKYKLLGLYNNNISLKNAPAVMGKKKQIALLLWKYLKY